MSHPLVTLTTDFGTASPYVAVMKGVLLGIHPDAMLLDLTHQIPPQDVRHAAFFLAEAIPYQPRRAVHLVVVDPGVGSERALLGVELDGHRLVVPDNGCWTPLADRLGCAPLVYRLTESTYWRHPVSATFHGRDILAPVAAHLSRGVEWNRLGERTAEWVRLPIPRPVGNTGEVIFVDDFGNLLTNLPGELAARGRVEIAGTPVTRHVRTYAEAVPGTLVVLASSSAMLEIAVAQGNAARVLGVGVGTPVVVR